MLKETSVLKGETSPTIHTQSEGNKSNLITCKRQCGYSVFNIQFEKQIGFACSLNKAYIIPSFCVCHNLLVLFSNVYQINHLAVETGL